MTTVEDIENAIAKLGPEDFDRLRAWLEEFESARFDRRIERDVKAGKLDPLADNAISDWRKGLARDL